MGLNISKMRLKFLGMIFDGKHTSSQHEGDVTDGTMIQLFHVSKRYSRRPAISDINLTIDKGEFVLLMGPSGAGKTTLLRLLFCSELPDEGQILVQNRNVARLRGSDIPIFRRSMGFIFQDFKLLPKKNVFDNVALPITGAGALDL